MTISLLYILSLPAGYFLTLYVARYQETIFIIIHTHYGEAAAKRGRGRE